jgi:phosphate transport system protein
MGNFMSRSTLEQGMEKLQNELLDFGGLVHHTIVESIEVLKNRDINAARQLIAADSDLNRRRFAIESDTLVLMARQQPLATDLRTLAAVLNIATELERIADYSKSNARNTIKLGTNPPIMPLMDIPQMAGLVSDMLQSSLLCFTGRNVKMAGEVASHDPEVDLLYGRIYRNLMGRVIADPRNIESASNLMWVAHNLERTADRAVNICERVIFTVTGEVREFDDSPKNLLECDVQAAFPPALTAREAEN